MAFLEWRKRVPPRPNRAPTDPRRWHAKLPADVLYDLACTYSLSSAKAAAKQDEYALLAVALLR
jgi:hypothetical protein